MKDSAAYHAASAGHQTAETGVGAATPGTPETPRPTTSPGRPEPVEGRSKTAASRSAPGLTFPRFFTDAGVDPFDEVEWELRAAVIGNERGEVVFDQRDVEIHKPWSQQATNIVVSKYFRGQIG